MTNSATDQTKTRGKRRRPRAEATLAKVLARQRPMTRKLTVMALGMRLAPIAIPIVLRFALDPLLHHRAVTLAGVVFTSEQLLGIVIVVGVVVAALRATFTFFYLAWGSRCGHSLVAELRQEMFEHILRMPVSYVDRRGSGKVLLRFIGDSDALRTWVTRTCPSMWADRLLLAVLGAIVIAVDWRMALVMFIPVLLLWLTSRWRSPRLQELTRYARSKQASFTGHVEARITELRQSKWLDRHRKNRRPTRRLADQIAAANVSRDRLGATLQAMGQLLAFLSVPGLIGIGIWLVWQGELDIGQFVALAWLGAHTAIVVHHLNDALVVRQKAEVSLDRILKLLERRAERGRSAHLPKVAGESFSLECDQLVFAESGVGSPARPLNLERLHGEPFAFDSETDLRALYECLLGFRRPRSGKITVCGQSLDRIQIQSLRKATAWIPARPAVFEGSVFENIRLAAPHLSRRDLKRITKRFLNDCQEVDRWLNQEAGAAGHSLTPEDFVRIGVLRAVVGQPRFVLIEELPGTEVTDRYLRRLLDHLDGRAAVLLPESTAKRLQRKAAEFTAPG